MYSRSCVVRAISPQKPSYDWFVLLLLTLDDLLCVAKGRRRRAVCSRDGCFRMIRVFKKATITWVTLDVASRANWVVEISNESSTGPPTCFRGNLSSNLDVEMKKKEHFIVSSSIRLSRNQRKWLELDEMFMVWMNMAIFLWIFVLLFICGFIMSIIVASVTYKNSSQFYWNTNH